MTMIDSIVSEPTKGSSPAGEYILYMASAADGIPAWGSAPSRRDRELRKFWPDEPIFASALYSTVSRYVAFDWHLLGPKRMVDMYTKILYASEHGKGWNSLMTKVLIDLFTQDNGAFIEVVRTDNSPTSPVIQLNHLDSASCMRTGRWETPVVYRDLKGTYHELKWYEVVPLSEFESPVEKMFGMQYCALTRLLRAAQILRDISIFKSEKLSGNFNRSIYLVSGVQKRFIDDALAIRSKQDGDTGFIRYIQPVVIASLDPTATVAVARIDLASLPDNFDEESNMRWYVNQMSLAFGGDYQDYAPLPGGNLGSGAQSETLNKKSRGKGPKLFMNLMLERFNYHGLLPSSVTFEYGEQDLQADTEKVEIGQKRALERKMRIESGELTPKVARMMAVEAGDLDAKYIPMLEAEDEEMKQAEQAKQQSEQALKLKLAQAKRIPGESTDAEDTAAIDAKGSLDDGKYKISAGKGKLQPKVQ